MDPEIAQSLRSLLETQRIASLGTLHQGEPYVSMVPFAFLPGGSGFVIHVSQLAAHTKDMLAHPRVSLLVIAPQSPDVPPQALARATIQGDAIQCAEPMPGHAEAKQAYLSRFPHSATMFELSDFSLFAIRPRSIRFVGGFAQAKTITPEGLAKLLGERR
jgi:heme iron utilization protein